MDQLQPGVAAPAPLEDLVQSYRDRAGVTVETDNVRLTPPREA